MNSLNALGFLLCGLGMILAPSLAPNLFPVDVMSDASSRLWVEVMGFVNGAMGAGYLLATRTLAFIRRCLALNVAQMKVARADGLLRPALQFDPRLETAGAQRKAA